MGGLVYLAGAISTDASGIIAGAVGLDRTVEEGYVAARCCALIQLAVLAKHLGSLDVVKSIVSVNGYVKCGGRFRRLPQGN